MNKANSWLVSIGVTAVLVVAALLMSDPGLLGITGQAYNRPVVDLEGLVKPEKFEPNAVYFWCDLGQSTRCHVRIEPADGAGLAHNYSLTVEGDASDPRKDKGDAKATFAQGEGTLALTSTSAKPAEFSFNQKSELTLTQFNATATRRGATKTGRLFEGLTPIQPENLPLTIRLVEVLNTNPSFEKWKGGLPEGWNLYKECAAKSSKVRKGAVEGKYRWSIDASKKSCAEDRTTVESEKLNVGALGHVRVEGFFGGNCKEGDAVLALAYYSSTQALSTESVALKMEKTPLTRIIIESQVPPLATSVSAQIILTGRCTLTADAVFLEAMKGKGLDRPVCDKGQARRIDNAGVNRYEYQCVNDPRQCARVNLQNCASTKGCETNTVTIGGKGYAVGCVPGAMCSDYTLYGQCAPTVPQYCDYGMLTPNCAKCGCTSGTSCDADTLECIPPCDGAKHKKCEPVALQTPLYAEFAVGNQKVLLDTATDRAVNTPTPLGTLGGHGNFRMGRDVTDSVGYLYFTSEADTKHKLPLHVPGLSTTTVEGAGRVFVFDQGGRTYYYEANTSDAAFVVRDQDYVNGQKVEVVPAGKSLGVNPSKANTTGYSDCAKALVGGDCVLFDMRYEVVSVDVSARIVTLKAAASLARLQGTAPTGTDYPKPLDVSLNHRYYLSSGMPAPRPLELEGLDGEAFEYRPVMVDKAPAASLFLVLNKQRFTNNEGETLQFEGTQIDCKRTGKDYYFVNALDFQVAGYGSNDPNATPQCKLPPLPVCEGYKYETCQPVGLRLPLYAEFALGDDQVIVDTATDRAWNTPTSLGELGANAGFKVGRSETDSAGYVYFTDSDGVAHKVPFQLPNLTTVTAAGSGRVFTFDQGAQSYYYEFNIGDQSFSIVGGQEINGQSAYVSAIKGDNESVTVEPWDTGSLGFTECEDKKKGDYCTLFGMRYTVEQIEKVQRSNQTLNAVTLKTDASLVLKEGTSVSGTNYPTPLNRSFANQYFLSSGALAPVPIELKGLNGKTFKYRPLVVDTQDLAAAFLVLDEQSFVNGAGETMNFNGTQIDCKGVGPDFYFLNDSDFQLAGYGANDPTAEQECLQAEG